jgi:uncharacterized membrane protein YoaT (DUF817 family)
VPSHLVKEVCTARYNVKTRKTLKDILHSIYSNHFHHHISIQLNATIQALKVLLFTGFPRILQPPSITNDKNLSEQGLEVKLKSWYHLIA